MWLAANPPSFNYDIPQGAPGTRATLRLMSRLVRLGRADQKIRQKALDLISHIGIKDYRAEIEALFHFVRDTVRYTQDANGMEQVHSADVVLDQLAGDCDDMSVLLAALLQSIGKPTRFIAVGFGPPGEFEHVYVEVKTGNDWLPLDPSVPVEPGWKPDGVTTWMIEHT